MSGKLEVMMTIHGGAQVEMSDGRCDRVLVTEYRRTQLGRVTGLESQYDGYAAFLELKHSTAKSSHQTWLRKKRE